MNAVWILAAKEIRDGIRNRWVAASILLLGAVAVLLSLLGSAPGGELKASALDVSVVSLASLSVYLLPLIALMLSFDALVGEFERGTMLLLLTYPVARWQVVMGKFLGHLAILFIAILVGYGGAAVVNALTAGGDTQGWQAYAAMMASSLLLGASFIAIGYLVSGLVRERATAVGVVIGLWLVLVVLYDIGLLGLLLLDDGRMVSQSLMSVLMLANPTDAYRVFNLTGFENISEAAGITGVVAGTGISSATMLLTLFAWVCLPLAAAIVIFQRREL